MARVTVEDCLARVHNRFALTILASRRARMLGENRGRPMVDCDNKEGVTALREISDGKVRFDEDVDAIMREFIEEQRRQLRVTTGEHTFLEAASLRALEGDEEDTELEEEEVDVEELPSDPEALGKKAKTTTETGEDEEAEEETDEDAEEEEATFEDEETLDTEIPEDLDDEGDEEVEDEEEEETP